MDICLSHASALEFMRSPNAEICTRDSKARSIADSESLTFGSASVASRQFVDDLSRWGVVGRPIHLLTSNARFRSKARHVQSHIWQGPYPKGSFVRIESGLYTCSPELAFIQLAQCMETVALVEVGFELCGRYLTSNEESQMRQREPLTCVESLRSYAMSNSSIRGAHAALHALQHVADNSASPMETKLAMVLSLPRRKGGYGLPLPLMNHRACARGRTFYLDICWPKARIGGEYDSRQFHSGADRNIHDSQRRNALADEGFTIVTITAPELRNLDAFDGIAVQFAKALGVRIRTSAPDYRLKQHQLWNELFNRSR